MNGSLHRARAVQRRPRPSRSLRKQYLKRMPFHCASILCRQNIGRRWESIIGLILCAPTIELVPPSFCTAPMMIVRSLPSIGTVVMTGGGGRPPDRKSTRLNSITNAHLVCRLLLETKTKTTIYIERIQQHPLVTKTQTTKRHHITCS